MTTSEHETEETMSEETSKGFLDDAEVIYAYTRAQAWKTAFWWT